MIATLLYWLFKINYFIYQSFEYLLIALKKSIGNRLVWLSLKSLAVMTHKKLSVKLFTKSVNVLIDLGTWLHNLQE